MRYYKALSSGNCSGLIQTLVGKPRATKPRKSVEEFERSISNLFKTVLEKTPRTNDQIQRLPDGQFAPKGQGTAMYHHDKPPEVKEAKVEEKSGTKKIQENYDPQIKSAKTKEDFQLILEDMKVRMGMQLPQAESEMLKTYLNEVSDKMEAALPVLKYQQYLQYRQGFDQAVSMPDKMKAYADTVNSLEDVDVAATLRDIAVRELNFPPEMPVAEKIDWLNVLRKEHPDVYIEKVEKAKEETREKRSLTQRAIHDMQDEGKVLDPGFPQITNNIEWYVDAVQGLGVKGADPDAQQFLADATRQLWTEYQDYNTDDHFGDYLSAMKSHLSDTMIRSATEPEKQEISKRIKETWDTQEHGSFDIETKRVFMVDKLGTIDGDFNYAASTKDNKTDLFHGTATKNAPLILSNGFHIPKEEEVVTGSLLGKGVYLAENSSKSAQYGDRGFGRDEGTGLLIGVQASLGIIKEVNDAADYSSKEDNESGVGPFVETFWGKPLNISEQEGVFNALKEDGVDTNWNERNIITRAYSYNNQVSLEITHFPEPELSEFYASGAEKPDFTVVYTLKKLGDTWAIARKSDQEGMVLEYGHAAYPDDSDDTHLTRILSDPSYVDAAFFRFVGNPGNISSSKTLKQMFYKKVVYDSIKALSFRNGGSLRNNEYCVYDEKLVRPKYLVQYERKRR